jgi:RNA-directed DNA polymerase
VRFPRATHLVVLYKEQAIIDDVFNEIRQYLKENGLEVHDIGTKTLKVDMSPVGKEKLNFLGFEISPRGIGVKHTNLIKFKKRIAEKVAKARIDKYYPVYGLQSLVKKIRFKILGNMAFDRSMNVCKICEKEKPKRSWLRYFLTVTDVRVLRSLDIWIRRLIYRWYYNKTSNRLTKRVLLDSDLPSLEKLYYEYKRELNTDTDIYCHCKGSYEDVDDAELE